jgi:hypothetical protein
MSDLDKLLEEAEWFSDRGPGSYTDEAYRKMPEVIERLIAVVKRQREGIKTAGREIFKATESNIGNAVDRILGDCIADCDRIAKGQMTREEKDSHDANKCL